MKKSFSILKASLKPVIDVFHYFAITVSVNHFPNFFVLDLEMSFYGIMFFLFQVAGKGCRDEEGEREIWEERRLGGNGPSLAERKRKVGGQSHLCI